MKPTTTQSIDMDLFQGLGNNMAIPRRAMQEMGFQSCCLLCDARDVAGTKRCRSCIDNHSKLRKRVDRLGSESPLAQFALELLQMISSPQKWDHDEVHGAELRRLQVLAGSLAPPAKQTTTEDISNLFAEQAAKEKGSVIQKVANRNPWKERPPDAEQIERFGANLPVVEDLMPGARTNPNRPIPKVDRSDRVGEDRELVDSVASRAEDDDSLVEKRSKARKDWGKALDLVDEILDGKEEDVEDDLDL